MCDSNMTDSSVNERSGSLYKKIIGFNNKGKKEGNDAKLAYSRLPFPIQQVDLNKKFGAFSKSNSNDINHISELKMDDFQCDEIKRTNCKHVKLSDDDVHPSENCQKCIMESKLERKESLGVDKDFYGHFGLNDMPQAADLGSCHVQNCEKRYRSAKADDDHSKPENKDLEK